ncbi:MAG: BamA/TamA family outer membrane protein [Planctomycetota bacterium]
MSGLVSCRAPEPLRLASPIQDDEPADQAVEAADETGAASDKAPILDGIDADGRIPKAKVPPDIEKPERWRYVPEGRLIDGNLFDRFLISSFIVPLFFFEEDIGFGGGVAVTDIDFRNQRRREFAGINLSYTTEGQQSYRIRWRRWLHHRDLDGGGIIQEERSHYGASVGFTKTLTRRFFGFGSRTKERNETSYTSEVSGVSVDYQQSFPTTGDDFVFGLGARLEHRDLAKGRVSGIPSTDDAFPVLFKSDDAHDSLSLNGGVRWDVRDSQHLPYRGGTVGLGIYSQPLQTSSDVGAVIGLDGSWIFPMPPLLHDGGDADEEHPPTDSLAFGSFVNSTTGDLPFWALPSLGGSDTLRGYIGNRWTDRSSWHASAEYRFWAVPRGVAITRRIRIERLGMAVFAEMGSVAPRLDRLGSAVIRESYGVSFRATFDRQALFRIDVGWSPEGTNLTIAYGLSF